MSCRSYILTMSFFIFLLSISMRAHSYSLYSKNSDSQHYLLAQNAEEDAYDPFSDYSEFDEASEEEADIQFFRNGRFLTFGFVGGLKGFTDNLSSIYAGNGTYGIYLSYFYDFRFALQFGFTTGDYNFEFQDDSRNKISGSVSFTFLQLALKYYMNTQNVTKGLAELNPYYIGGISQVYRTYTLSTAVGSLNSVKDTTFGLDLGAGIEIPMLRKKGYFGFQFTFHYVNFPDSNSKVRLEDYGTYSTMAPFGYHYDLLGVLGINF